MKQCMKCGQTLPFSEYYKHSGMADGYLNKCKTCTKRDVRENRAKKIDYYKQYDKDRAMLPHRVEARKEYAQTEQGKEARLRARKKWLNSNQAARKAHTITGNAIRDGRLKRQPCSRCGDPRVEAHHPNYLEPLDVMWLCRRHHNQWHLKNGPGKNGEGKH